MALFSTMKNRFQHYRERRDGVIILLMIVALTGCAHDEKRTPDGESSHEGYRQESTYQHASQKNADSHHFSRSMEEELMLTDDQKEDFHKLQLNYDKMVVKKTADVRMAEVDLAELIGKDNPDRQAIKEQVETIGEIKEDMMMARIDSLMTLKGMLNKDQYGKFREILHQRMNQVEGHSPHGGM